MSRWVKSYSPGLLDWGEAGYIEDDNFWPWFGLQHTDDYGIATLPPYYRQYYIFNVDRSAEYFCLWCRKVILTSVDPITNCYLCGSHRIIRGEVGSLDESELKDKYKNKESNMARLVTVDFTGIESGGAMFTHVPEGDYALEIVKVIGKKGKESNEPNLRFSFKLSDGPKKGNGRVLEHNCSLQKQSLWNFRNLLEALGKAVPSKAVKIDVDKLVGLKCAASIVDGEYNNRTKSEIGVFFPIADLGKTGEAEDLEEELEEEVKPKKKVKGKAEVTHAVPKKVLKEAEMFEEEESSEESTEESEEEEELFN